ncbi:MAG TPA: low molecular weight protein-tyrosine-phosphatase [Usitatibacter sp.]|jgi:protein-tyrosine phosphatase|nr:low molecular weight protein-tyrosine-phosphatase [Usitatibacter sp.]
MDAIGLRRWLMRRMARDDGFGRRRSILVVCTANVCRSAMAEVVLRKATWRAGLDFDIDSAATHEYMIGMPPAPLAVAAAKRRGYNLTGLVSRRVRGHDFRYFDLILAVSRPSLEWLRTFAPHRCGRKIRMLTDYSYLYRRQDIPDPYGGGLGGFETALDMIEDACQGVVRSFVAAGADSSAAAGPYEASFAE